MKYEITESTSGSLCIINLDKDESIRIERGSMVYKTPDVDLEGKTNGGVVKGFLKSVTTGESMFITTAKSRANGSQLAIAPSTIGKIVELEVGNKQYVLNDGAFLACTSGCNYSVSRVNGIGGAMFGNAGGFYNMTTSGSGTFFVNSFGDLVKVKCNGALQIDNSHAVAWDSTLKYSLQVASGTFGFKTGEGLIMNFQGEGYIYVQTRSVRSLADIIIPFVPQRR